MASVLDEAALGKTASMHAMVMVLIFHECVEYERRQRDAERAQLSRFGVTRLASRLRFGDFAPSVMSVHDALLDRPVETAAGVNARFRGYEILVESGLRGMQDVIDRARELCPEAADFIDQAWHGVGARGTRWVTGQRVA